MHLFSAWTNLIYLPHSACNWCYSQCNQWSNIPQPVRLQGSHSLMEAEVIWHIQSEGTGNAGHLCKNLMTACELVKVTLTLAREQSMSQYK